MKRLVMLAALAAMAMTAVTEAATLSVTNVVAQQRYPWNGLVDIDYELVSDSNTTNIYVYPVGYDKDFNVSYAPRTLTGDGANGQPVKPGKHRLTWNMGADMPANYHTSAFSMKVHAFCNAAPYLVVDLSGGTNATNFAISYLSEVPNNGVWDNTYRGDKLVLKLIPPGTFMMGSPADELGREPLSGFFGKETQHQVQLTQPFYCGVFEVTERQWTLIMGGTSSAFVPQGNLSYNMLRGSTLGAQWPANRQVDATSFLGILQTKTGITFDLPTEAQWEYACRAGTSTALNNNQNLKNVEQDAAMDVLGRYCKNGGAEGSLAVVGSYKPNVWGLYDMHGNVEEWCLDWFTTDLGQMLAINPTGVTAGDCRIMRGGSLRSGGGLDDYWNKVSRFYASSCRSSYRSYRSSYSGGNYYPSYSYYDSGCRLIALPAAQ